MEIPYIVEPRKDTGLFNAKIAIWLFLASEVMLFGGLFSAYIFLRLGADFPWPERALPIVPGLINTAILIASSVTVVFAWAELKLRNWRKFQIYMSITLICAVAFMCIKLPFEYAAKFAHQAVRTHDFVALEGHVLKEKKGKHKESLGNYLRVAPDEIKTFQTGEGDDVKVATETGFNVSVTVTSFYEKYLQNIIKQAKEGDMKTFLYLGENKKSFIEIDGVKYNATTPLSIETLELFKEHFLEARTNNHNLNARLKNKAQDQFYEERENGKHPAFEGKNRKNCEPAIVKIHQALIDEAVKEGKYFNTPNEWKENRVALTETVTFHIYAKEDAYLKFVPAKGNFGGGTTLVTAADVETKRIHQYDFNGEAKEEEVTFKYDQLTILHRDKTTIKGTNQVVAYEIDEETGKAVVEKNEEAKEKSLAILKQDTKKIRSGIELAVDQIDVRHFLMRLEQDDADNKPLIEMYLGRVDENGKYITPEEVCAKYLEDNPKGKGLPEAPLFIFQDDRLTIDYYTEGGEDAKDLKKRFDNKVTIRNIWATHMKWAKYRNEELKDKGGITELEQYVVNWKQMVGYRLAGYKMESQEDYDNYQAKHELQWYQGFVGANHRNKEHEASFPYVWIPRQDIFIESNLTPKWNNYYAIYFTITGLHGLHVIGGALVLAYYLFFGKKMFDSNPEWLANRVEVGGLFWHFVDLVWIFAFPIFYLM